MDALIHLVPGAHHAALFDVAGKPLVIRQIQWLRAAGFEHIAVELPADSLGVAVSAALDAEPLGPGVIRLLTSGLEARQIVADPASGLSPRVLLLPADVLGDGDLVQGLLKASSDSIEMYFDPPSKKLERLGGASALFIGPEPGASRRVRGPGWGAHIRDDDGAFLLSLAILDGAVPGHNSSAWPVQVHASKISSGVWVARGAEVHDTAHLVRPVFIGAGAVVNRDAVVGPGVMVGNEATVGSCSRLLAAAVEPRSAVPASTDASGARFVPALPTAPRRPVALVLGGLIAAVALAGLALRHAPSVTSRAPASSFSSSMVAP